MTSLLKKCKKCGLPETYETIEFNGKGICNICVGADYKKERIDWVERKKMLDALIESHRGKAEYDCIIPFSGGKDSTWTLHYLVKEYNLKPLVIQFDHGFMRPNLLANNQRIFKKLGVAHMTFTPSWSLVKKVMLEALIRKGDFCWHCHTGIFSYPMRVALMHKVPLVLWGEPSSDYTAYYDYQDDEIESVDEERFNKFVNLGISADDMLGMIDKHNDIDERDLLPFKYPPIRELKQLRYNSVCLGSYIPWDPRVQSKIIADELGWQGDQVEGMPPGLYDYEKIECHMQGVRDYIKYLKRGYSRVSQMVALDIRAGRMDSEEAARLVAQHEGKRPASLEVFLEYVGISEAEFNEYVMQTVIAPHKPDFASMLTGVKNHDFDSMYREI
tara:strand:+ start:6 stop:1166 length:1161 start_codon:yes stop_codon:yes gene_type:complete